MQSHHAHQLVAQWQQKPTSPEAHTQNLRSSKPPPIMVRDQELHAAALLDAGPPSLPSRSQAPWPACSNRCYQSTEMTTFGVFLRIFEVPERHHPRNPEGFDQLHSTAHAFVRRLPRLPPVRSSHTHANMFGHEISHALSRNRQEQHCALR